MTISMFKARLTAFLKIRPEETRMVLLMAGLFLCVQAGQGIGENAAFALFLSSIDVDFLPYMYMGLGGVVFIVSLAYSASLSRFQNANVIKGLLAGSAILFALEWLAILVFRNSISYPLLWLTTYGLGVVLGTLLWTSAGEVCDARQAKRLFPLFTSMGILGSVLGNLLTGVIASLAGTDGLILLYALLLGGGFLLIRRIARSYFRPEPETSSPFSLLDDLRAGYNFVNNSQLFRLIAISSILYSILFFTVDFPFSERISLRFADDAAGLASFKGLFTSITTAVTFLVSLFLANRLYARLGIVNSVLVMPVTYIAAFGLFFLSFNFWGAVGARFGQLVILGGLGGTAWNALFNVVPPDRRGQVLAFNSGVPSQVGVVLSGLLIILSRQVLTTQDILLLGAFVALVATYITMKMRPAYGDALLSALRAGRVEVFSDESEEFSGYRDDPVAMQVILKSLQDPRAATRRLAVEMLAKVGSKLAVPDLIERLSDEDPMIRVEAVKALTKLDARLASGEIILGLDDPDDSVREQTLASLPRLEVASSPELIRTLERLLKDSNIKVAARAAVVLTSLGEPEKAVAYLSTLVHDDDESHRVAVLDGYLAIVSDAKDVIPFERDLLLGALRDPSPAVRRKAVRAASLFMDDEMVDVVARGLSDEDVVVRRAVSDSLKQAWPRSRSVLLRILSESDGVTVSSALDAIPAGDADILHPLKSYIQREVAVIHYWRSLIDALPYSGRTLKFLVENLKYRVASSEERLVKAVGLFGNPRAMDLVRKGLVAGDVSSRAAALETLETLGDKRITYDVLPILDRGGLLHAADDQKMKILDAINILLGHEDQRLRILALYTIAELQLRELVPALRKATGDPDPLVKESARDALSRVGGTVIMKSSKNVKTLKTLSKVDRILLLREVPMFAGLSPDDLERVAEIAEEQLFLDQSLLCREGEYGDTLFVVTSGKVDVIKSVADGEKVLASRGVGEFVGEMAILESAPRSATLRANGTVRVLVIDGNAFNAILLDRPEVAVSALRHMSKRVRQLNEQVGAVS